MDNKEVEEVILIEGLKKQNQDVFDLVFSHYYSGLCAFANRYLNNRELAEDVVQDMFVKLWEKSATLNINTSLKAYLSTSVRNLCLDILKHQKVKEAYKNQVKLQDTKEGEFGFPFYIQWELEETLDKALDKLPPRCRHIFEKSRFEGMSNNDIAEELQLSKRTVELQISNALKILRNELKPLMTLMAVLKLFA